MQSPIPDQDIYECSRRLLEAYGADAAKEARSRRTRMLEEDDFEGYLVWSRVERVLSDLMSEPDTAI